jgi:hypothetical protein
VFERIGLQDGGNKDKKYPDGSSEQQGAVDWQIQGTRLSCFHSARASEGIVALTSTGLKQDADRVKGEE